MTEPTNIELEDAIRKALRDLDNPMLDKGRSRGQLLRAAANLLDHAKVYAWTEEQRHKVKHALYNASIVEAMVTLVDSPDFKVTILYVGLENAFITYGGIEDVVYLGCIDPTSLVIT